MQTYMASPFVPAIKMRPEKYFYSTQSLSGILEGKKKKSGSKCFRYILRV